jgi:hypothetical protein
MCRSNVPRGIRQARSACLQSGKADALLESGEMRMPGSCSICFGLYVDEYRDFPKFDYEVRSGPSSGELTRLC